MKLSARTMKKAEALDDSQSAGKKLNRKQRRFLNNHWEKYKKANVREIMDGEGPHPGCSEFM